MLLKLVTLFLLLKSGSATTNKLTRYLANNILFRTNLSDVAKYNWTILATTVTANNIISPFELPVDQSLTVDVSYKTINIAQGILETLKINFICNGASSTWKGFVTILKISDKNHTYKSKFVQICPQYVSDTLPKLSIRSFYDKGLFMFYIRKYDTAEVELLLILSHNAQDDRETVLQHCREFLKEYDSNLLKKQKLSFREDWPTKHCESVKLNSENCERFSDEVKWKEQSSSSEVVMKICSLILFGFIFLSIVISIVICSWEHLKIYISNSSNIETNNAAHNSFNEEEMSKNMHIVAHK